MSVSVSLARETKVYDLEGAKDLYNALLNPQDNSNSSWNQSDRIVEYRKVYKELFQKHITSILESIALAEHSKVVECGAGFLVDGKNTHLSQYLPQSIRESIIHTDLNEEAVKDAHTKISPEKFVHLSATQLASKFSDVDMIVAGCFIDTLSPEDLAKMLDQAFAALKDEGIFLHISDLPPYEETIILDHKDKPGIMFPLFEGEQFMGVQFVTLTQCKLLVENSPTGDFLSEYINISNDKRAQFLRMIDTDHRKALSKFVKDNFDSSTMILKEEYFSEKVKTAFKKTAFKVVEFGLSKPQKSSEVTENTPPYSDYIARWGFELKKENTKFKVKVNKELTVHVIVAKKSSKPDAPKVVDGTKQCCVTM